MRKKMPLSMLKTLILVILTLLFQTRLRAKLARGEEKRGVPGPQPPAANMRAMVSKDG